MVVGCSCCCGDVILCGSDMWIMWITMWITFNFYVDNLPLSVERQTKIQVNSYLYIG